MYFLSGLCLQEVIEQGVSRRRREEKDNSQPPWKKCQSIKNLNVKISRMLINTPDSWVVMARTNRQIEMLLSPFRGGIVTILPSLLLLDSVPSLQALPTTIAG